MAATPAAGAWSTRSPLSPSTTRRARRISAISSSITCSSGAMEAKNALAELIQAGVQPLGKDLPGDSRAALVELETPERPSEYRIGFKNFYVITRYNRSAYYAAAVNDLANALREAQRAGK